MGRKKLLEQHKKFGTTDDLNSNSTWANLKKMDFDDMMYGTGLVQGIDLINSLDQKHEKKVFEKMNDKIKNGAGQIYDKSFWDQILSSDSSETELEIEDDIDLGLNSIIYGDKLMPSKKIKKRGGSDAARRRYKEKENQIFTPNPNKSRQKKKRIKFHTEHHQKEEKITTINLSQKKKKKKKKKFVKKKKKKKKKKS